MNFSGLSFNALPPIDLPFRFFITAPLFVIMVAFIVLWGGENIWLSRWHPSMLAITHGITLGCLTSVMMGALIQILPVVGAGGMPQVRLIASVCHALHVIGTLCLLASFIFATPWFQWGALIFLMGSFSLYIGAVAVVLSKKLSQGETITSIKLAVLALVITVILGFLMQGRNVSLLVISPDKWFTNLHALWGLIGWACLLIIAVSFQIIPMFHVAPAFPKWLARALPLSLFTLLISYPLVSENGSGIFVFGLLVLLILCIFSGHLLLIINQRKRKVPDTSIHYWQLSAITIFVLTLAYMIPEYWLADILVQKRSMLLTSIFIFFYLLAIIQGMLLKILPFLSYTHLQQQCLSNFNAMPLLPHMHEFLRKSHAKRLFVIHVFTGITLIATIVMPTMYWLFGLSLLIEFLWLFYLILHSFNLYQRSHQKIAALD